MTELLDKLIYFLGGAGSTTIVLIWIINNPEKLECWMALFYRYFSWLGSFMEYGKIGNKIQAVVNTFGKTINDEVPDLLPHLMKIEWAKSSNNVETILRNGDIVVTLDPSKNQDKNIAVSTLAYLHKGLLPHARPYVDNNIMTATDYTIAKKIIASSGEPTAVSFFIENFLETEIAKVPLLRKYCTSLEKLNESGYFTSVFLRQLQILGRKVYPLIPNEYWKKETREFLSFLHEIAKRSKGQENILSFPGLKIRLNVMLVARAETKDFGTIAYARRTEIALNRGLEQMYICGWGSDNIALVEEIAEEQEKKGNLSVVSRHNFLKKIEGSDINAICIACDLSLCKRKELEKKPENILYKILEEEINKIREGKIQVVALSRKSNIQSKIVVRSYSEEIDPVKICTEESILKKMESSLGQEKLTFIQWTTDLKKLIVDSLKPLDPNKVIDININSGNRTAMVIVDSWEAKRKALGGGNHNRQLACEVTGWNIYIEEKSCKS